MIGKTISHYKITAQLGEGGMGVVYKAEDTKLERTVALKFLAAHLMANKEAGKRFIREAKAAAALDHPNICTVHEIDEVDDHTFIAMAYLEGETLDKKIAAGPVPLDDLLDIATQIARGLEAAHHKSIYHRDIKPANVMILDQGSERLIKIMDFGLAQLAERSRLTDLDTTLGTMAYMSPEQTEGVGTDQRTDLWALGCVMYEMISGQLPFRGDYNQAVQYSILHEAPEPLTGLRTGVPMELEWIVDKCLAKKREERYPEASALILDVSTLRKKLEAGRSTVARGDRPPLPSEMGTGAAQWGRSPGLPGNPPSPPAEVPAPGTQVETTAEPDHPLVKYHVIEDLDYGGDRVVYRAEDTQLKRSVTINVVPESAARAAEKQQRLHKTGFFATAALLAAAFAVIIAMWLAGPGPAEPPPLRRFAYAPPEDLSPGLFFGLPAAISPNGKHIAAGGVGSLRLWIQDLDQQQPREIEGAEGAWSPFWSPGSDFSGFAAGNELKKVSVQGGLSVRLCELPGGIFYGGSWSPDGELIVFGSGPPYVLYQVPARGGDPELLISREVAESTSEGPTGALVSPYFLPGEAGPRVLVFTFGSASGTTMMLQDLESGRRETLGPGHQPFYSAGHIVYQLAPGTQDLWALPFSLETLTATGEPFPFVQAARSPTAGADGTLVYFDGTGRGVDRPTWFDRRGTRMEDVGRGQTRTLDLSLSPDERRVAFSAEENGNRDIWVHDIELGVKTRVTTDSDLDFRPIWSPNGEEIVFSGGNQDILLRRADGSGEARALLDTPATERVSDWSRDGKYILYVVIDPENSADLWYLERSQEGGWEPHLFLQTAFRERSPSLSPDGRFVAYASNESGRDEIYVQPFPKGGRRTTVSNNGGWEPRWSPDGRELFYVEGTTLTAVSVDTSATFSARSRTPLFEHPNLSNPYYPQYDISADGQRFIIPTPVEDAPGAKPMIRVVQNWAEEFRDREGKRD